MGAGTIVLLVLLGIVAVVVLITYAAYLTEEIYDRGDRDHRPYIEYNNTHSGLHALVYDLGYTADSRRDKRKATTQIRQAAAKVKNTERFNGTAQKAITK